MQIIQNSPIYIRLNNLSSDDIEELRRDLTYKDLSFQYAYLKAKNNVWAHRSNPDWPAYVDSLKQQIKKNALLEDEDGFYTYAGLLDMLERLNYKFKYTNNVKYPASKAIPYDLRYKPYTPYTHQKDAVELLTAVNHAAIRLPTGAGKSTVLENLIKENGYSTLLMVPTTSIFEQLYNQLVKAFGKKYVGRFGGGKKEFNKKIVVGIAASLTRLHADDEAYQELSKKDMFLIDEAHLVAADTLAKVGLGLAANIPYRYSVSATPERNDGRDMLLEGLIGPVVYEKHYRELVDKGILAKLNFTAFLCESESGYAGKNPKKNSQEHCLYNKHIIKTAALLANTIINQANENVLILVDEKEQLSYLKPFLTVAHDFAHSGSDVTKQIQDFNNGKITCLVGTSAVAIGSDFKGLQNLIFLMSGKSSIKVKQAIGRATRVTPTKTSANIYDFHVVNDKQSSRHFKSRLEIYESYADDVQFREAFA